MWLGLLELLHDHAEFVAQGLERLKKVIMTPLSTKSDIRVQIKYENWQISSMLFEIGHFYTVFMVAHEQAPFVQFWVYLVMLESLQGPAVSLCIVDT